MVRGSTEKTIKHIPVLRDEAMVALALKPGGRYIDATFGGGGYSEAILKAFPPAQRPIVYAIDRDPKAIERGKKIAHLFPDRLHLLQGKFSSMVDLLRPYNVEHVDGIVFDLGMSSFQIEEAERGFSFKKDGPLDMRMGESEMTAADVVNGFPEEQLRFIFWTYGGEKNASRIARAIVRERQKKPFETTQELVSLIHSVQKTAYARIDPATRCFQALRIVVNDELGEIEQALEASELLLSPGGRLVVVAFHSLEDRLVKNFMNARSGRVARPSRYMPFVEAQESKPTFHLIQAKALKPSEQEKEKNVRARSAKLRIAERSGPDQERKV